MPPDAPALSLRRPLPPGVGWWLAALIVLLIAGRPALLEAGTRHLDLRQAAITAAADQLGLGRDNRQAEGGDRFHPGSEPLAAAREPPPARRPEAALWQPVSRRDRPEPRRNHAFRARAPPPAPRPA